MKKNTAIKDVRTNANHYNINGDMINGGKRNDSGEWVPYIDRTQITRPISKVDTENGKIYCPCGRVFLINENLSLKECDY